MAYCSKCGTQLSDGTKFCPKCGNPIGSTQTKEKVSNNSSNNNLEPSNETSVQDNEKDSLSTWEKIALGVAGFVAISGIFGGFGDGMWIAVLISLCALGAICAVFMGTIEKKYAWTTAIVSFLVVCGAIGASTPNKDEGKQEQAQTEQKQESPAEKQARKEDEYAKYVGKWRLDKIVDGGGKMRMEVTLNADKSGDFAVFIPKGSSDDVLVYEEYPQCKLEDGVIYLTKNGEIIEGKTPQVIVGSDGLYSADNHKYVRVSE